MVGDKKQLIGEITAICSKFMLAKYAAHSAAVEGHVNTLFAVYGYGWSMSGESFALLL